MSLKKYGLPEFESLKTSTRTMMVDTNIRFNLKRIFKRLYVEKVDVPLTKKKKNVDKKKLTAPYGAIIGVQSGIYYRGIDSRKSKKRWCTPNCRKIQQRGDKEVNVNTVIEERYLIDPDLDIHEIRFFCTECERYYKIKELKKIANFLNQVTIIISVGDIILNIMMFKTCFKIAGCKNDKDAYESIAILWEDYISKIQRGWRMRKKFLYEEPRFMFRLVMRNVDFELGFFIDRQALNRLMNSSKYIDKVHMSQCETTGHPNVNIKMHTEEPEGYIHYCLEFPQNGKVRFVGFDKNIYKREKPKKPKYATFIVFSSSQTILTGRYEESMKNLYIFFVNEVMKYRKDIEEHIEKPKIDLASHMAEL